MNHRNEYLHRGMIGLLTAGFIVFIIPLLFFSLGEETEKKVSERELERYFSFWCRGTVGSLFQPRIIVNEVKERLESSIDTPEQQERDERILETNKKIRWRSFTLCLSFLVLILIVVNATTYLTKSDFVLLYFESILGTMLFVIVEVIMVLTLFSKYHPLDVNFVNKYLVEKML